jgi:hypothetical protein
MEHRAVERTEGFRGDRVLKKGHRAVEGTKIRRGGRGHRGDRAP